MIWFQRDKFYRERERIRKDPALFFNFKYERSRSYKSELRAFSVPATQACSCKATIIHGNVLALLASASLAHKDKQTVRRQQARPLAISASGCIGEDVMGIVLAKGSLPDREVSVLRSPAS